MSFFDIFRTNEFKERISDLERKLIELGYDDYASVKAEIERNISTCASVALRNRPIFKSFI